MRQYLGRERRNRHAWIRHLLVIIVGIGDPVKPPRREGVGSECYSRYLAHARLSRRARFPVAISTPSSVWCVSTASPEELKINTRGGSGRTRAAVKGPKLLRELPGRPGSGCPKVTRIGHRRRIPNRRTGLGVDSVWWTLFHLRRRYHRSLCAGITETDR
jgi:hypothetical protein